jgi:Mycobacterium 19 kDa lipoprotein antigen
MHGPNVARRRSQIGRKKPIANTVDIHDFDSFSGIASENAGNADVSLANDPYVITRTAEGSDPDHPGKTGTVPYRIATPC